ncbi:MAG: hypothetical protein LC722_03585 [Actinobacteria bacterium]|nr:hypothetical protein [Actinomycetota bacterium]
MVTAAAVLLFIGGAFGILGGIFLLQVGGVFSAIGVVSLIVGALQIYAGTQILAGHERGRMIGIVLAGVGALFALISIAQSPATGVISLAINGFVIYALVQNAAYFQKRA